jgi:hypothetical protein
MCKSRNSLPDPTHEELVAIRAKQGLEEFEPARSEATADGALPIDASLATVGVVETLRRHS